MAWAATPQQSVQGVGTTAVAATASLVAPQSGATLLAWVGNTTSTTRPVVSDTVNGTWTCLTENNVTATLQGIWLFAVINTAATNSTVSSTLAGAKTYLSVAEWRGGPATLGSVNVNTAGGILDVNASSTANNTAAVSQNAAPSVTTVTSTDLVVAGIFLNNTAGGNTVPTNSFTLGQQNPNSTAWFMADAFRLPGATGTFNPSFTWVSSRKFQATTVALLDTVTVPTAGTSQMMSMGLG